MSDTINLGQVQALHVGGSAPENTGMLWFNPDAAKQGLWLAFNKATDTWQAFAGEARLAGANGNVLMVHNLGVLCPGTVLGYNDANAPVAVTVIEYVSPNEIQVNCAVECTLIVRP